MFQLGWFTRENLVQRKPAFDTQWSTRLKTFNIIYGIIIIIYYLVIMTTLWTPTH